MTKITFTFILLTFSISNSFSQKAEAKLIGTWKHVVNESKSQVGEMLIGASAEKEVVLLTFHKNNEGFDSGTEEEFEYSIDGKVLIMGDIKYDILKLSKKKMILKKQPKPTDLFGKVLSLQKVNK